MQKRNRKLAAALGVVAATGMLGASEIRALLGNETTATPRRQIVAQAKNGEREAPSGRKAFLVAADDYGDAATALACTKNDVEALAARLVEIGFDANDVVVLKTGGSFRDYPTKANVEARFAAFVKSLRPGDFAIVYLSGHGVQPTDSKEAFFAPIDVDPSDIYGSAVSINGMLDALEKSDATFRWAIVDACRNDPEAPTRAIFTTKTAGAKGLVEVADAPDAIMLLQSCQPGDFSYEGGVGKARDVKNGFFTLSLLEALDSNDPKADADGDGALMFTEVVKYVTARTNELAFDYYGKSQKPNLCGSITDFPLLDELRVGGLTVGERERADRLYREACALRRSRQYESALSKIREALAVDATNADYLAEEADIKERLKDQAEAERLKREKEEAERRQAQNNDWMRAHEAGAEKSLTIKKQKYTFCYCPAKTFTMGEGYNEHEVSLTRGFWMLKTEVTQALWKSVMGENPSWFCSTGGGSSDVNGFDTFNFPVERVSWNDCQKFIAKLNSEGYAPPGLVFRLPTQWEWEYACLSGRDDFDIDTVSLQSWCNVNSDNRTHQVATKPANRWGLHDMFGNVGEWCSDWVDPRDEQSHAELTDVSRVSRGGGWDFRVGDIERFILGTTERYEFCGLRLVLGREL